MGCGKWNLCFIFWCLFLWPWKQLSNEESFNKGRTLSWFRNDPTPAWELDELTYWAVFRLSILWLYYLGNRRQERGESQTGGAPVWWQAVRSEGAEREAEIVESVSSWPCTLSLRWCNKQTAGYECVNVSIASVRKRGQLKKYELCVHRVRLVYHLQKDKEDSPGVSSWRRNGERVRGHLSHL